MDIDKLKEELADNIDQAIERGNVDQETLELMKELLKNTRPSIRDYYEETKE